METSIETILQSSLAVAVLSKDEKDNTSASLIVFTRSGLDHLQVPQIMIATLAAIDCLTKNVHEQSIVLTHKYYLFKYPTLKHSTRHTQLTIYISSARSSLILLFSLLMSQPNFSEAVLRACFVVALSISKHAT